MTINEAIYKTEGKNDNSTRGNHKIPFKSVYFCCDLLPQQNILEKL